MNALIRKEKALPMDLDTCRTIQITCNVLLKYNCDKIN